MTQIDIDQLAEPIDDDAPCGEDLEYDNDFAAMEAAAAGKPEQQVGDSIIAAEDPNWRQAKSKSLDLLARTKDIRVCVVLARALLQDEGFDGLRAAFELTFQLLSKYWPQVHPQLDEEDDDDPTARVNAILGFCDSPTMLYPIQTTPFIRSVMGAITIADLAPVADSEEEEDDGYDTYDDEPRRKSNKPERPNIDAVMQGCEIEDLKATIDTFKTLEQTCQALDDFASERIPSGEGPNMRPFLEAIKPAQAHLAAWWERRGGSISETVEPTETETTENSTKNPGEPSNTVQMMHGEIKSREDVIRMLDKICQYYERYEPSSPLPLLLLRAKRLASKSFLDILSDLAPKGFDQAMSIGGLAKSNEEEEEEEHNEYPDS